MTDRALLDVSGLRAGYGATEVLRGIDLNRQSPAKSSRCWAPTASANRR